MKFHVVRDLGPPVAEKRLAARAHAAGKISDCERTRNLIETIVSGITTQVERNDARV